MSRGVRLSIVGLYNYNSDLFSDMVFPAEFTEDEKQTVVYNILSECAELECLFADPDFMQQQIELWSKINIPEWQRIYTASLLEYNPIENYNRTELETVADDRTDTHSGNDVNRSSGTDTDTISSSNTETHSGTDTNTNSVSSYDSNTYQPHNKDELLHGHSVSNIGSGSNSTAYGKTETLTHGEIITHDGDITRNNHTSGNIGVTTSQQMLEQEVNIAAKLNVMKMIVNSFKNRFCLLVY